MSNEMNELVAAALGKYLVAAAPNGLSKVGFDFDGDMVEIEEAKNVPDRLTVSVEGQVYATIDLKVQYWEIDESAEDEAEDVADEAEPAAPVPAKKKAGPVTPAIPDAKAVEIGPASEDSDGLGA